MKDRIKEARKALGKKQKEFAEAMHLAPNYISLIESGKNEVSDKFIFKVCETFGISENWIRTGEGEMFEPLSREDEIAKITLQMFNDDKSSYRFQLQKVISEMTEDEIILLRDIAKRWLDQEEENLPK